MAQDHFPTDHPTAGDITIITGCMFSGKTDLLIRKIKRAHLQKKTYQIFKPSLDNRYGISDLVISHTQQKLPAISVDEPKDILMHLKKGVQVIGIDEVQFFSENVIDVMEELAKLGISIIASGLDTDWQGRPFHPMPQILAVADHIEKQYAVCSICGANATRTQRLVSSNKTVLVGAGEVYQARCRTHFDPTQHHKKTVDTNENNTDATSNDISSILPHNNGQLDI